MTTTTRFFSLPESFRSRASEILTAEARDTERLVRQKRFTRGLTDSDLAGFLLNHQPLRYEQLPRQLRDKTSRQVQARIPGESPPRRWPPSESWLQLSSALHSEMQVQLVKQSQFRGVLDKYRDLGQLPDWLVAFASHQGQCIIDLARATPCIKESYDALVQANYVEAIIAQRPELARFYVPMIPFELAPNHALCVMPFLSQFVTLDDLICEVAGLRALPGIPILREELMDVIPEVICQVGEILRLARGKSNQVPINHFVLEKLRGRFSTEHDVPLLVGEELLKAVGDRTIQTFQQKVALLNADSHDELAFGHGDLNATNIMVAVQRKASGQIAEVCVRLIDPNPDSAVGGTLFEIARLVHWIELCIPLRHSRTTPQPAVQLNFSGSETEEDFLNRPPHLIIGRNLRDKLEPIYSLLVRSLNHAFPNLSRKEGADTLTLGTAFFHLIATKFWSRNIERTSTFWAGVHELDSLTTDGLKLKADGLWAVRRRLRGRRPY